MLSIVKSNNRLLPSHVDQKLADAEGVCFILFEAACSSFHIRACTVLLFLVRLVEKAGVYNQRIEYQLGDNESRA